MAQAADGLAAAGPGSTDEVAGLLHVDLPADESQQPAAWRNRLPSRRRSVVAAALLLPAAGLVAALLHTAAPGSSRLGRLSFLDMFTGPERELKHRSGGRRDPDSIAECVVDTGVGSLYLARAGLEITAAASSCQKYQSYNKEAKRATPKEAMELLKSVRGLKTSGGPAAAPGEALAKAQVTWSQFQNWQLNANLGRRMSDNGVELAGVNRSLHEEHKGEDMLEHFQEVGERMQELKELKTVKRKALAFERICAADIAGTISSFSYVASYYSALVSQCQSKVMFKAYCASDVSKMLASIAEMTAGAAAISAQCTSLVSSVQDGEDDIERRLSEQEVGDDGIERRLHEGGSDALKEIIEKAMEKKNEREFEHKEGQFKQAACAIEVSQAALFVARFGIEAKGVQRNCEEGFVELCAGSIAGMLSSLALVSMMVSNAVGECPAQFDVHAVCSSAISQLLAGVSELASSGFLLADSCYHSAIAGDRPAWEWSYDYEKHRGSWVDEYGGTILTEEQLAEHR